MKKCSVKDIICYLLLACAFVIVTVNVVVKKELAFDNFFYNLIVVNLRNPALNKFMIGMTYVSGAPFYIGLLVIFFIFFKNKKIPALIMGNMGISLACMWIIKHIVQRPRPDGFRLVPEDGYSFASGHSLNAMVFYGLLIYVIHNNIKNKGLRITLEILLGLWVLLIGISRIYLGVHYASDVLGGFIFGLLCVSLYIKFVYKRFIK